MNLNTGAAAAIVDPLQAALALRAQGRLQEALDLLSTPGHYPADFYTLRGDIQMELGQFQDAAGSYFTVTVSKPSNVHAQSNLGMCLARLQRWQQAASAFQAVLRFDPHRDSIQFALGNCLLRLNRFEEALTCFDECRSEGFRNQSLFGKAVTLQMLRRFDEAQADYERLLALDPQAEEVLANLIALNLESFNLERIGKYSRRLIDLNPSSFLALQGLALVALEQADGNEAARYFRRLQELGAPMDESESANEHAIEYRVSQDTTERLNELMRDDFRRVQPGSENALRARI